MFDDADADDVQRKWHRLLHGPPATQRQAHTDDKSRYEARWTEYAAAVDALFDAGADALRAEVPRMYVADAVELAFNRGFRVPSGYDARCVWFVPVCKLVLAALQCGALELTSVAFSAVPVGLFAAHAVNYGGAALLAHILDARHLPSLLQRDASFRWKGATVLHVLLQNGALALSQRLIDVIVDADAVAEAGAMLLQRTARGESCFHSLVRANGGGADVAAAAAGIAFIVARVTRVFGDDDAARVIEQELLAPDEDGITPLGAAAMALNADALGALLALVPSANLHDVMTRRCSDGMTVLGRIIQACKNRARDCRDESVVACLACLATIERAFLSSDTELAALATAQMCGVTVLHVAATLCSAEPLQILLSWVSPAWVHGDHTTALRDAFGRTVLMWAADAPQINVVRYLVAAGPGFSRITGAVDDVDGSGNTALVYALSCSSLGGRYDDMDQNAVTLVVEELLRADVDALQRSDSRGRTPLMWAAALASPTVFGLLCEQLRHMPPQDAQDMLWRRDADGHDALWIAAVSGNCSALTMLPVSVDAVNRVLRSKRCRANGNFGEIARQFRHVSSRRWRHENVPESEGLQDFLELYRYPWRMKHAAKPSTETDVCEINEDYRRLYYPDAIVVAALPSTAEDAAPRGPVCVAWGVQLFRRVMRTCTSDRAAFVRAVHDGDVRETARLRERARTALLDEFTQGPANLRALKRDYDLTFSETVELSMSSRALAIKWRILRELDDDKLPCELMRDDEQAAVLFACLAAAEGFHAASGAKVFVAKMALTDTVLRPGRVYAALKPQPRPWGSGSSVDFEKWAVRVWHRVVSSTATAAAAAAATAAATARAIQQCVVYTAEEVWGVQLVEEEMWGERMAAQQPAFVLYFDSGAASAAAASPSLGAALGVADADASASAAQWCAVVRRKIHLARTRAALHFGATWPHHFAPPPQPTRVLSLVLVAPDAALCELAAPLISHCLRRLT
jgi:ankyrin repeat protein